MTERTLRDQDQVLVSVTERQRQLQTAGRRATLDVLEAYAKTARAFAESQERLAATTEVEWLSRLLRAQATFTREMLDASERFAREVMEA